MPGIRHGAKRGAVLVLGGFLLAIVGSLLAPVARESGLVPWWVLPLVGVGAVVSLGLTVKISKYWSYRYLGGFVLGIAITLPLVLQTAFLGLREVVLYGGAALAAVFLRAKLHL